MPIFAMPLFAACSDYGLEKALPEPPEGWPQPPIPLGPAEMPPSPRISVSPSFHDFGAGDPWTAVSLDIVVRNIGRAPLTVDGLDYAAGTSELVFSADEGQNGPLPWVLAPGEPRTVTVTYTPTDEGADEGALAVRSDDPATPRAEAMQVGAARFEDFATGWYIVNDDTPHDLTSDPSHRVDYDGDPDAYW